MTQIDPAKAADGTVLFEHREGVRYPVRIYKDSTSKPLPVSIHGHVHDIANAMVALLDRLREAEAERDRLRDLVGRAIPFVGWTGAPDGLVDEMQAELDKRGEDGET